MPETIHYISDLSWFSNRKVNGKYDNVVDNFSAFLDYIARQDNNVFAFNLNKKEWLERANFEISKRWDSRIAGKMIIALPLETNRENVNDMAKLVQTFIAYQFNVPPEHVGVSIHLHRGRSGHYNPHAHVVIYPRDVNGKKVRVNRKNLSILHREWEKTLKEIGYTIKKYPEDLRIEHIGVRLYYDEDAQELYAKWLETVKEYEKLKRLTEKSQAPAELAEKEKEEELISSDRGETMAVTEERSFFERFLGKKNTFREKQKSALALHFKRLGYKPSDRLAVVLVNHQKNKVLQRVFSVEELLSDKVLAFLGAKNAEGYSVYASINTLKPNAVRRRKEDFEDKQKRIYIDLDAKGIKPAEMIERLWQFIVKWQLPNPSHIVKSSKGNYQVYWTLNESVDWQVLECLMEKINDELGTDHTQDVSRVFRLPFFRNKKPGKDDLVLNIDVLKVKDYGEIKATGKPVSLEVFKELIKEPLERLPKAKTVRDGKVKKAFSLTLERIKESILMHELKDLIDKGYSKKVAIHLLKAREYLADYYPKEYFEEFFKLFKIAAERNKEKSPSEVDLAFAGLVYTKYNGNPSPEIVRGVLDIIEFLAEERKGPYAFEYAERTLQKVKDYWEEVKTHKAQKVKEITQKPIIQKPSSKPKGPMPGW